jgi:hypothetical protein
LAAAAVMPAWFADVPTGARPHAVAHFKGFDDMPVGIATFSSLNRGVPVEFDLSGLRPSPHRIHLGGSGNCDLNFNRVGAVIIVDQRGDDPALCQNAKVS